MKYFCQKRTLFMKFSKQLWWILAGGQPGQPREGHGESIARTSAQWASPRFPVWSLFLSATAHSCNDKALGTGFLSGVHRLPARPVHWSEASRSTDGRQTLLIYPRLRWPDGIGNNALAA